MGSAVQCRGSARILWARALQLVSRLLFFDQNKIIAEESRAETRQDGGKPQPDTKTQQAEPERYKVQGTAPSQPPAELSRLWSIPGPC